MLVNAQNNTNIVVALFDKYNDRLLKTIEHEISIEQFSIILKLSLQMANLNESNQHYFHKFFQKLNDENTPNYWLEQLSTITNDIIIPPPSYMINCYFAV